MRTVADTGEFGLIERIARLTSLPPFVIEGIGDDCAVIRVEDRLLLISSDLCIEDVHFRIRYCSPEDIGYKAAARALSDIAAMGGAPLFCVTSVGCPSSLEVRAVESMYRGMAGVFSRFGAALVGGDTAQSPDRLVLDVTVVGRTVGNRFLRRRGAQPGDLLCVTGTVGAAAAGLHALEHGIHTPEIVGAHLRPHPRIAEGQWLCDKSAAHALIDVSDGLAQDAGRLADAAGLGLDIDTQKLPVAQAFLSFCAEQGLDPVRLALTGGEDYELACAMDPEGWEQLCESYRHAFHAELTAIGVFTDQWAGVRVNGEPDEVKGFDHFTRR